MCPTHHHCRTATDGSSDRRVVSTRLMKFVSIPLGNRPVRVNLGCGPMAPAGWINIDGSPNVLLDRVRVVKRALRMLGVLSDAHMTSWPDEIVHFDVRKPLPFEAGSVECIYSSHLLEHLYLCDAQAVLGESRRVLATGGVLRLALPDAEQLAADLLNGVTDGTDDPGLYFNRRLWAHPLMRPSRRQKIASLFGGSTHRWQPTRSLVTSLLKEAGFTRVWECRFLQGNLPDLATVEHREESFFLEAA